MRRESDYVMRKALAEYFHFNRIITAFFTVAGITVAAHLIALIFTSGGIAESLTLSTYLRGSVASWFIAVMLAIAAIVAYNLSRLSESVSSQKTWSLAALVFLVFSMSQVTNLRGYISHALFDPQASASQALAYFSVLAIFGLWLAYRLSNALAGSANAKQSILLGVALYFGGSAGMGLLTLYYQARIMNHLWPVELVMWEAIQMLGVFVLLSGVLLHEQFLYAQLKRVASGRFPGGIPKAPSTDAEWVMRMIGTPTREELEMAEEVMRARRRRWTDALKSKVPVLNGVTREEQKGENA